MFEIERDKIKDAKKGKEGEIDERKGRKEGKADIMRLLMGDGAWMYLCGGAGMARDVGKVLGECMREEMGLGEERWREWCDTMKKTRRWQRMCGARSFVGGRGRYCREIRV